MEVEEDAFVFNGWDEMADDEMELDELDRPTRLRLLLLALLVSIYPYYYFPYYCCATTGHLLSPCFLPPSSGLPLLIWEKVVQDTIAVQRVINVGKDEMASFIRSVPNILWIFNINLLFLEGWLVVRNNLKWVV